MGAGKINILFLADSNSIHDIKWISYFDENDSFNTYILKRKAHFDKVILKREKSQLNHTVKVGFVRDFSIVRVHQTIIDAIKIKRIIQKYKIDIVHILYAEPSALWCNFRSFLKTPMLVTCRGTDVLITIPEVFKKKSLINSIVAPAYRNAFKKADWITGTSLSQLESIKNFLKQSENLSIVRTGVEIQRILSSSNDDFPLNDDIPYVLFPRYIKPVYNHELALEAISLLPPSYKNQYKFVFIGKDSGDMDYQRILEAKMNNLVGVKIEFIEKQSQQALFALYKKASLVVMVPKSDGSPVSAMEALLCGSRLILGALQYDQDIFSENVIRMETWEPLELKKKMVTTLQVKFAPLSERVKLFIDRSANMNNVTKIYKSIIKLEDKT